MFRYIFIAILFPTICNAEIIAFVGHPVLAERLNESCMDYIEQPKNPNLQVICMDGVFRLKYSVSETLKGNIDNEEIEFIGFYHYLGLPSYTSYTPALVVIEKRNNYQIMLRIEPTEIVNDNWWVCEVYNEDNWDQCDSGRFVDEIITQIESNI